MFMQVQLNQQTFYNVKYQFHVSKSNALYNSDLMSRV